ncbi:MAG: DUF2878 domain-containing protein [Pseudomonadales bacterium]
MSRWNLANGAVFQLAWFACVIGGAAGTSLWGAVALAALLGMSIYGGSSGRDLGLAGAIATVGFMLESLWIHTGVLDYQGASLAPAWIVMLWAAVGLTVNHCLSMFKARPWLGGLLAGAGAPFSYLGGERLGAVIVDAPIELLAVSAVWLVLFTAIFMAAREVDRMVAGPGSEFERVH